MRLGVVLVLLAACYSPHAQPGAPCTPELANCPAGQSCALVSGSFVCVAGTVADGGSPGDGPVVVDAPADVALVDAPADVALVDAPRTVDAAIDARGVDAPPPSDGPLPPAKWTLVQVKSIQSGSTLTLSSATTAGDLLAVAVEVDSGSAVAAITDNGGDAFTAIPAARASSSGAGRAVEIWYAKAIAGGATTISVTAPSLHAAVAWEVAGLDHSAPLDTAAVLNDQGSSATPLGASITTSAAGEFVIGVVIVDHFVTGIHAGNEFTNDSLAFDNGWAHLTDGSAAAGPHQPQWNQSPSGTFCASSVAFRRGP